MCVVLVSISACLRMLPAASLMKECGFYLKKWLQSCTFPWVWISEDYCVLRGSLLLCNKPPQNTGVYSSHSHLFCSPVDGLGRTCQRWLIPAPYGIHWWPVSGWGIHFQGSTLTGLASMVGYWPLHRTAWASSKHMVGFFPKAKLEVHGNFMTRPQKSHNILFILLIGQGPYWSKEVGIDSISWWGRGKGLADRGGWEMLS